MTNLRDYVNTRAQQLGTDEQAVTETLYLLKTYFGQDISDSQHSPQQDLTATTLSQEAKTLFSSLLMQDLLALTLNRDNEQLHHFTKAYERFENDFTLETEVRTSRFFGKKRTQTISANDSQTRLFLGELATIQQYLGNRKSRQDESIDNSTVDVDEIEVACTIIADYIDERHLEIDVPYTPTSILARKGEDIFDDLKSATKNIADEQSYFKLIELAQESVDQYAAIIDAANASDNSADDVYAQNAASQMSVVYDYMLQHDPLSLDISFSDATNILTAYGVLMNSYRHRKQVYLSSEETEFSISMPFTTDVGY